MLNNSKLGTEYFNKHFKLSQAQIFVCVSSKQICLPNNNKLMKYFRNNYVFSLQKKFGFYINKLKVVVLKTFSMFLIKQ
jgi:hypothetical protein